MNKITLLDFFDLKVKDLKLTEDKDLNLCKELNKLSSNTENSKISSSLKYCLHYTKNKDISKTQKVKIVNSLISFLGICDEDEDEEEKLRLNTLTIKCGDSKKELEIFDYELTKEMIYKYNIFILEGEDQYTAEYISNILFEHKKKVVNNVGFNDIEKYYNLFFNKKIQKFNKNLTEYNFNFFNLTNLKRMFNSLIKDTNDYLNRASKVSSSNVSIEFIDRKMMKEIQETLHKKMLSSKDIEEFSTFFVSAVSTITIYRNDESIFYYYTSLKILYKKLIEFGLSDSGVEKTINSFKNVVLNIYKNYKDGYTFNHEKEDLFFSKEAILLNKSNTWYSKKSLLKILNILSIEYEIWSIPFNIPFLNTNEVKINSRKTMTNNLKKKKYEEVSFEYLNLIFLVISYLSYYTTRILTINNKWLKNNSTIEYMIIESEKIINKFINTDKSFHPHIYHRLTTLISLKNSLKIRYNIDNKKWNTLSLIRKYEEEVLFILNNRYHFIGVQETSKGIEELGKVQNAYNYFGYNYTLEKEFLNQSRLLFIIILASKKIDEYLIGEDNLNIKTGFKGNERYIENIYENRLNENSEITSAFATNLLYINRYLIKEIGLSGITKSWAREFMKMQWNLMKERSVPKRIEKV